MMRTIILYNNIGPYHIARIRALQHHLSDIRVIELAERSSLYLWRTELRDNNTVISLFAGKAAEELSEKEIVAKLMPTLNQLAPDVVVTAGYADLLARTAVHWASRENKKRVLMIDSWMGDKRRFWIKEQIKRYFVQRWFDAAFVGGWRHVEYARSLGFADSQIWRGVDVVDNHYFIESSNRARENAAGIRARLQLPSDFFLCVARYSPEKNLVRLLKAFRHYRQQGGSWHLLLLGDGPQRGQLASIIQHMDLSDYVRLEGWVQYEELPNYYGLAKALIFPSISETWGLVVNEAMASALPVLVTRKAGCLPELCWRGINGFDFDPWDVDEMAQVMLEITRLSESERKRMGEASRRIIANFTPETWATTLAHCIHTVAGDMR